MSPVDVLLAFHVEYNHSLSAAKCYESVGDDRLVILPSDVETLKQNLGMRVGLQEQELCSSFFETEGRREHLVWVFALDLHPFERFNGDVYCIVFQASGLVDAHHYFLIAES